MNINQSLLLAKQHSKNNNLAEAKKLYLEILNKFPSSKIAKKELKKINTKINQELTLGMSQEQKNHLMNLYLEGEFEKSLDESIRLSKMFPKNAFLYNIKGISLLSTGRYEEAIESYKEALKRQPLYADAYYNIGVALLNSNKYEEAIEAYKQALKINPEYVNAYNNMGITYMYLGKNEEAIESYKQSLKIQPHYANAHYNIGITLFKIGKNEEAIESYKEALKIQPNYVEARNNLASALLKINKNEEAIEVCEQALKIKPNHFEAYSNMGSALINIGKNEEAIEACQQALKIQPTLKEAMATLITILIQSDNDENLEQLSKGHETYLVKILLIIDSFIDKSFDKCKSLILQLRTKMDTDLDYWLSKDKDRKFITAYLEFIGTLNSNILEQKNRLPLSSDEHTIYHIGESHSLTFAHQNISLENKSYTIKPLIIFGTKAWHLGNKEQNQYKTYFENYVKSLEEKAYLLLSFGEIDCRVDEGIINYYLKTKCNLADIVYQTVKNYIEYTERILNKLEIKRIYMGVPAPVIKVHNDLTSLRIDIVKLFNENLLKITQERELNFIDIYRLTVNNEEESNLQYMCDNFHLSSSILGELNLEFK